MIASARPAHFRLPVGDGHELNVETAGTRAGPAAVYLHGGPGSGCQPGHRQLFDLGRCFAVFPDQRGAGRSTPKGSRIANTTAHLVADLEAVREALGIERWLVVGGSWGATLGLAYAEAHPERVSGLVLRAVFLGTRAELEWAFLTGLEQFRPELNQSFLGELTIAERADPLGSYWRRILAGAPEVQRRAAWAWHDVERVLSEVEPRPAAVDPAAWDDPARPLPSTPFMEAHYFSNGSFLTDGQLLAEAGRLAGIPGALIQGRYDLLCPPTTSARLAAAWPEAQVVVVERAGHAQGDPGVTAAMTAAVGRHLDGLIG